MKNYSVFQVDSFTKQKFKGNPAGVVLDADGLSEAQMQSIARELNNSETAFLLSPVAADHDVWIRFFTPTTEVPLCGHTTIAAHYVRAKISGAAGRGHRQNRGCKGSGGCGGWETCENKSGRGAVIVFQTEISV